jgi:tetratricopeptide (TPR) repeat protein
MIAFRLAEAEQTFAQLAQLDGGHPAAAHHLAKIAWWRAITMEQAVLYDAYFERSDAAIALLRDVPEGPWRNLFRAETELHRSTIHAKKGENMKAALSLRQAYVHFERNAQRYPEFSESQWGMGLCYAIVGSVPRGYRWVLRTLGYRGSVAQGMRQIAASADHSSYYRDEAAIFYAILDEVINESRGRGADRLRAVYRRHPDSPVMQYLMGFLLLNERDAVEAEKVLRRASTALSRPGVYPIPLVDYYLADALFRQNRFAEAVVLFEQFLASFPGKALRAQSALKAGLSREMLGDRAAAERHYRAVEAREDNDADESARREARDLLARRMNAAERSLLLARNAFDGGRTAEAVRQAQVVLADRSASDLRRAEAAYRIGRAYQVQRTWHQALQHYEYAVHNPGDPLAKWGPWSQFYIGEVYAAMGRRDDARQAYQRALANEQRFEYHKSLEQRARAALERL